jgi:hypothetical protein
MAHGVEGVKKKAHAQFEGKNYPCYVSGSNLGGTHVFHKAYPQHRTQKCSFRPLDLNSWQIATHPPPTTSPEGFSNRNAYKYI